MKKFYAVSLAVLASVILCFTVAQSQIGMALTPAQIAATQNPKIIKADLATLAVSYSKSCPGEVRFTGTITVDGPGKVAYIFGRSDGSIDTITKTVVFDKAGSKKITDTWQLAAPYKGWEEIRFNKALGMQTSNRASFEFNCGNNVKAKNPDSLHSQPTMPVKEGSNLPIAAQTPSAPLTGETNGVQQSPASSGPINIHYVFKGLKGSANVIINPDGSYLFSGSIPLKKPGHDFDIAVAVKSSLGGVIILHEYSGDMSNGVQWSKQGMSLILQDDFATFAKASRSDTYSWRIRLNSKEREKLYKEMEKKKEEARKNHEKQLLALKKAEDREREKKLARQEAQKLAQEQVQRERQLEQQEAQQQKQQQRSSGGGGGVGSVLSTVNNAVGSAVGSVLSSVGSAVSDVLSFL